MTNTEWQWVLVLDGNTEPALAIARSLGKRGVRVAVGASQSRPLAAFSRYCSARATYPNPVTDVPGFQEAILEQVRQRSYSLIIPVTDVTIGPLMQVRNAVEEYATLGMASNESLGVALSKSRTCEMAKELGVSIPNTFVAYEPAELDRLPAMWGKVSFPVVIKPERSKVWSPDGKGRSLSVSYAWSREELYGRVSPLLAFGPVVLQEHVPGQGVGIGILASHGRILMQCQYRRLHEVPLTGGGSSYRVTEAIDPRLAEWAGLLTKRLCWHGVAMVEFKIDRERGKAWLIEINGRFWGALPLAVAAGADFPRYVFELMVEHKDVFPAEYRIGLRCRNFSKDSMWLRQAVFSRISRKALVRPPSWWGVFVDCCRILNPKERSDTLDLADPWPGLIDLYRIACQTLNDVRNKLLLLKEIVRISWIRLNPKSVVRQLEHATNILVVCSGNVIRSPFAANLLANSIGRYSVRIVSAGLYTGPGRPADPRAVMKAKPLGVDLSCHTSLPLTPELVERADVIFVMEAWQILEMRNRYSQAWRKTFLLTSLYPQMSRDIPDPMFKGDDAYATCFDQIILAVRSLSVSVRCDSRSSGNKRSTESQSMERPAKGNWRGLKRVVKLAVLGFGPTRKLLSWLAREHIPIFMYHRFGDGMGHRAVSREAWCAQLDELTRSFRVLSLEELCRQRREGRRDWRGTCVITVDDGYRDFYEVAYPELKKRNLSATLFVTTGFLHPGIWLWWDAIRYVIDRTVRTSATIAYSGGTLDLDLATEEDKQNSWALVGSVCCRVSTAEKWEIIRSLSRELNVTVPDHPSENYQGCTVDELSTMAEHGITFGSHSVNHPILTQCEPNEWQEEIRKSYEHLCTVTKGCVKVFAFPNGMAGDYSDGMLRFLEDQKFEAGVVAHYDNFRNETQFALRRCEGSADMEEFQWKLWGGEYAWTRFKELAKLGWNRHGEAKGVGQQLREATVVNR